MRLIAPLLLLLLLMFASAASAATLYVDTDGSGDYNCDGTDDHIEINYALDNASASDTVHVNASTYLLDDTVWINTSGIIFEGDGAATILKIKDNAEWAQFKRMVQVENPSSTIQDMTLDGNYWGVNATAMPSGANYGDVIYLNSAADYTIIKDIVFNTTRCDPILAMGADYLNISDCIMHDTAHDAIHGTSLGFDHSTIYNIIIDEPTIATENKGNAGIRPTNGRNNTFTNITINGMSMGIELEQTGANSASDNTFTDFVITNAYARAIWIKPYGTTKNCMEGNAFTNIIINETTGTGIYGRGFQIDGITNNVTIENVGIYNMHLGIDVDSYKDIIVKNCIITNSTTYGVDGAAANVTVTYSNVWNSGTANYNGVSAGTGCISSDALFADAPSGDFHLDSTEGRWTGSTWTTDAVSSPCIDIGDPSDSYANEPSPNGSRINMGAYGNTNEASKSASGAWSPSIFGNCYNTTSTITITTKGYGDYSNIFSRTPTQADGNATSGQMVVRT